VLDLGEVRHAPHRVDPGLLSRAERPRRFDGSLAATERAARVHVQGVGAADHLGRMLRRSLESRAERPVLESRVEPHVHVDRSLEAANASHDRVMRSDARRVDGIGPLDGHAVRELDDATVALERGDEDVGVVEVGAPDLTNAGGLHREGAAALRVEDCRENRGRIEPREARPVDRSVEPHQGSGVTVTDERVIPDPVHGPSIRSKPRNLTSG
jgi:hypothetical protein